MIEPHYKLFLYFIKSKIEIVYGLFIYGPVYACVSSLVGMRLHVRKGTRVYNI